MKAIDFTADPDRVERFRKSIREEYDEDSIIREAADYRQAPPDEVGDFVRIGLRFYAQPDIFIKGYAKPGTYVVPEIIGVGRGIAFGEQNHLLSEVEKSFKTTEVINKAELVRCLDGLPELFLSCVFAPIDYFVDLHLSPDHKLLVQYENRNEYLVIGDKKARVFWSNKYVKFTKFYFIGRGSLRWVVKPDPETQHSVRVTVVPDAKSRRFDVTAETVARAEVLDDRLGLALSLGEPPTKKSA